MLRLLSLCLWQVLIVGILSVNLPTASAQEAGIQIRGPKSTDVFPHERYGPITASDTLWKVALAVRPDPSVSVYQVMQALFELNPNAFADNNRNHLVNGQYLQIPSIEKIRLIDPYIAKAQAERDDKKWQKKVETPAVKEPVKPEELAVKKKDLDEAKVEINEQLKTFDSAQKQKLDTIQQDVLDSIDGLQAILRENESLKNRLSNFNDQLGVMQQEVAKGQEVKAQMDDMLALQKELLAKAEERERQLLLEKQQAELEKDDFMSSLWFKVLMGTLPALLIASIVALILARRKKEQPQSEQAPVAEKSAPVEAPVAAAVADIATDNIDGELSLDEELSLDDELSIDLTESEDDADDLFGNDLDDLDDDLLDDELTDDVIHLDDELEELDDLEDISLDDDLDELSDEGEPLEGGELNQGDLDDLLSGIDDDDELPEPLEGGELNQGDLDDLLSGIDDGDEEVSEPLEGGELGQNDLDDLLSGLDQDTASDSDSDEELVDLDNELAGLDEIADDADVTDPDDIDALLNIVSNSGEQAQTEAPAEETSKVDDIADDADVTDPDDIDALLNSVSNSADQAQTEAPAQETSKVDDIADDADVTDPDDIDALLNSVSNSAEQTQTEAQTEAPAEETSKVDDIADDADVTDPDDIDALLNSVSNSAEQAQTEAPAEETSKVDDIADDADVTDPDDIDALLASINAESEDSTDTLVDDGDVEITDPDDIDALLASIDGDTTTQQEEVTEPESVSDDLDEITEITDAEEIEALLDDVEGVDNTDDTSEHQAQIEAFTEDYIAPFLALDFSDINSSADAENTQAETAQNSEVDQEQAQEPSLESSHPAIDQILPENQEELSDDLDIDSLIADVQEQGDSEDDVLDIGDDILGGFEEEADDADSDSDDSSHEDLSDALNTDFDESTLSELLNDEKESHASIELSPDFTDSNVLADLLADGDSTREEVSEANELDDIQELDSLDFDELLANIEEESASSDDGDFDLTEELDIGNELTDDFDTLTAETDGINSDDNDDDFISVDSLLSDSLEPNNTDEPYQNTNIDVGLGEFPEFGADANDIDVDDDNGVTAKLDLAKVYLEIGDKENAEIILLDILQIGDAEQQIEAQQLLDNM
ncbi:FimV/HubP family polar landmark protein [Colwellia sp. MEBiC06753]